MTDDFNIILATDSYKLNHHQQYPRGTRRVYSYLESREGARHPTTLFFGLQYVLKRYLVGRVVTEELVTEAHQLAAQHFSRDDLFNAAGWTRIVDKHGGRLPLRIKAVSEGTEVPVSNVLMTVENTDPKCYWLTNYVESLLTHVWYPSTVATVSHAVRELIGGYVADTADVTAALPYMLHDFGYRGASSHETAALGGAAHLLSFAGTDNLAAMRLIKQYYHGPIAAGASVPATEHSVMTSLGKEGEYRVVDQLLSEYPDGVLSVVADSYSTYKFVEQVCTTYRDAILERDGTLVVRPDSVTIQHTTPEQLVEWILDQLWVAYGGHVNSKGYRVLDPHVRVLWGDGLEPETIQRILGRCKMCRYCVTNLVFGMGGGLLQKVNRDTQRFAFKASAIKREGEWHDVYKCTPRKASKRGRLALTREADVWRTVRLEDGEVADQLQDVFLDGELLRDHRWAEIVQR